jgi:CHAT domain-containing protein
LQRSGLVFAGANHYWKGETLPQGLEDGLVTAKEISSMVLTNTQLVVLSACQTGLGDIRGGEGVFGLQRGFKMAGVKTLIMSLWKVPDVETALFMKTFYGEWLTGKPLRQAFIDTQRTMSKNYPNDPYKWAAFVMVQ